MSTSPTPGSIVVAENAGDDAVVAEDGVAAVAERDAVDTRPAEDEIVTVAADDRVVPGDRRVDGRRRCADDERAVVAEDHVDSVADRDAVIAGAAEHDVVAVAGEDRVVARGARILRLHEDRNRGVEHDAAVVAEDDVVAVADGDAVVAGAAEDEVVAVAVGDHVARADARAVGVDHVGAQEVGVRRGRRGLVRSDRRAADDDVPAGRAGGAQVRDTARVAEDDVVAAAARDGVGPGAAEEQERDRARACVDRVVAALAVDREVGTRRDRNRGVDDVVALAGEERRQRLAERRRRHVARVRPGDGERVAARAAVDVDAAAEQAGIPLRRPVALAREVAAGRAVRDRRGRETDDRRARSRSAVRPDVSPRSLTASVLLPVPSSIASAPWISSSVPVEREVVLGERAVQHDRLERGEVAGLGSGRRREQAEVRGVGDVDDVVARPRVQARARRGAADVEAVVAGAEPDREVRDVVVVDAVRAGEIRPGRGQCRRRRLRPRPGTR